VSSKSNDKYLRGHRRKREYVKTNAESEVMTPKAKEAARSWKRPGRSLP
jgi:hypothetical protein